MSYATARWGRLLMIGAAILVIVTAPDRTIALLGILSIVMTWALYSRRELAAALAHSAQSEELVRSVLEAAPDAMLITDGAGTIVLANTMAEQQFGYTRDELVGGSVDRLVPVEARQSHRQHRQSFDATRGVRLMGEGRELEGQRSDGSRFAAEIALSRVNHPDRRLTVAAVRDVTLRRQTEQRLRESVAEKELLLKEVHHRVKNNLQLVASLLALQADKTTDPQVQAPLEDCRQRVMSMALVHEKLYGANDLGRIDLGDLMRQIALMLISETVGPSITTSFNVQHAVIDIERAVPVCLAVNELMTNSLKHAFRNRSHGHLSVAVLGDGENRVRIEVADDGQGGIDLQQFRTARTLGMTIVRNLVRQLDAELSVRSGPGTTVAFTFPVRQEER